MVPDPSIDVSIVITASDKTVTSGFVFSSLSVSVSVPATSVTIVVLVVVVTEVISIVNPRVGSVALLS